MARAGVGAGARAIARMGGLVAAAALGGALVLACGEAASGLAGRGGQAAGRGEPAASTVEAVERKEAGAAAEEAEAVARRRQESPHHVVFADRISQSYALLLADQGPAPPPTPSREALRSAAEEAFSRDLEDPEVGRLLAMIMRAPEAAGAGAPVLMAPSGEQAEGEAPEYQRARELLALHVEVGAVADLIEQGVFADPALVRGLSPAELGSLAGRRWALVLRADYRNQNGVRGLRLLQALVRVVAAKEGALIYDPDTQETVGPELFAARRLRAELGNVADQVAVVPFADPRHGEGFVRLTTRGMRRFGSVDLELDGLPATPRALQRATFLLHGLARLMVKLGEAEASGLAVEAPAAISLTYRDCDLAYAGRGAQVPRCKACPEEITLHLVERAREPHDPLEHVVARVVAPRGRSDAGGYDHPAWAAEALVRLFGE